MSWPPNVWNQVKNLTCDEIISALKKDLWEQDTKRGAELVYKKGNRRVVIHYHPRKTYRSAKLLNNLIEDIGWSEADLRRLKLIS